MLFSVGYTLPYDQSWVIYSLSQVQNFLGDEGAHPPSSNPLMYLWLGAAPKKWSLFLTTFLKQKQMLGA
jgi:hypothetical protein